MAGMKEYGRNFQEMLAKPKHHQTQNDKAACVCNMDRYNERQMTVITNRKPNR